jgi:NAD(P)H-hydrate epimerase
MGRLAGIPAAEVQENRIKVAVEFAKEFGCWTVLKGAGTITAAPNGHFYINSTGNSWMASGGQGDVLSGILGGLLVQNIPPEEAIPLGVYLHGKAADDVVARRGGAPVSAGDVIGNLSCLIGELTKQATGDED